MARVVLSLSLLLTLSPVLAQTGRYTVGLHGGKTVSGDKLSGWHHAGQAVSLDGKTVSTPGKPLKWLRDGNLKPWRAEDSPGGYIEFVGGDRFVGTLLGSKEAGWADGMFVPAHLTVRPASTKRLFTHGTDEEIVRILPGDISRVVFNLDLRHKFQPGFVFLRDRRRVAFIRLRWGSGSVQLLLNDGAMTVPLRDIAEIHMPRSDPWKAYYRQLAVLSPDCASRLIRIETTEGVVATGSEGRFRAEPFFAETILRQAIEKRKHYLKEMARLEEHEEKQRQRHQKSLKKHLEQTAKLEAAIKRETEDHAKALVAMGVDLEKQLQADAVEFDKQRKQLRDKFDKEVKEIEKRVAGMQESKRPSRRKSYIAMKKKSLERSLKSLDKRQEQNVVRRKRERENAVRQWTAKKASIVAARQKLDAEKVRFEKTYSRSSYHADRLVLVRKLLAALPGPDGNADTWCHMVQPAWSLDPLWVPFNTIVTRSILPPATVPLSRVRPARVAGPPMLRWRIDRNTDGGPLFSGAGPAGWGFGVHARSELSFAIPPEAVSFQSRLGLDRIVADGGCAQARVYLGSTESKPVYESPMIIGSAKTFSTGTVLLPDSGGDPRSLVLQVDPIARNHPPNADPLNIRDKFDWLEPQINLAPKRLRDQVERHAIANMPVWRGWTVSFDKGGVYQWGSWYDWASRFERGLFLPTMSAKGKPLKLSREMKIPTGDKWLIVDAGRLGPDTISNSAIRLRIDGKEIPAEKMPVRQSWRPRAPELVYSLKEHSGKEVKFELAQTADGKPVYWRSLRSSPTLPGSHVLREVLDDSGAGDMQLPRGLGMTLQSGRIKKSDVLEALEINKLGGRVTFCNEVTGQFRYEYLYGVMIGRDWRGGDKTFDKLKDIKWVRNVLLAKDAGVSAAAADRLKNAKGEHFVIRTVERTPSGWGGRSCDLTVRNRTQKTLTISRVHGWGGLTESFQLKPGAELTMHCHEAQRFEAHAYPGDHNKSKPVSSTWIRGDTVWEIK